MKLQLQVVVTGNGAQQLNATATAVGNIGKNAAAAQSGLKGIITTIRDIRTIMAVIESAKVFTNLIKEGIEFNALLQTSQLSLAAIITTFTDMTDATGRHLSMIERYGVSQKLATDLQNRMKVAAFETTLAYEDLLNIMQRGLPYILKYMADIDGKIPSNKKIVDFAAAFSQGAAVFGLHPNEVGGNIRALMTGTANDRTFRFANALLKDISPDPKKVREQLKEWREQGVIYEELTKKIAAFKHAGKDMALTYTGVLERFKDAIQQALGAGTQQATKDLTDLLGDLAGQIARVDANGQMVFNPEFVTTIQNIASGFVMVAKALSGVAGWLVTIGAHLQAPNMKNLLAALAGAVAGGLATGSPWGAMAGGAAMYFSSSMGDTIEQERAATAERNAMLGRTGGDVAGKLSKRSGGSLMADASWGNNTEAMMQQLGLIAEQLTSEQLEFFIRTLKEKVTVTKMNEPGIGEFYRQGVNRMDFLKAKKAALEHSPAGDLNITANSIDSDDESKKAEKVRVAALALERYRDSLESIERQLSNGRLKDSLDAVMDSFDALAANTTDPFASIDVEKQKAEVKALNDYYAELRKIDKLQDDLNDAKKKASLSKTTPADLARETKVQEEINKARGAAEQKYIAEKKKIAAEAGRKEFDESKKLTEDRNKWTLERVKLAYKEHMETGVYMQEALASAMVDLTEEAWNKYYDNRLAQEEKLVSRIKDLYDGLTDSLKTGMRDVIATMMNGGGSGGVFTGILDGFKQSWNQYLASVTDKYLSMLSTMAQGNKTPYRYTQRGETGPNDPGGMPVYASSKQTKYARIGLGAVQAGLALYGLYQGTKDGQMSKNEGAMAGATQGLAVGSAFGPYGAIAGAAIGGVAGYAMGGQKAGYEVTVKDGKISIRGLGKAKAGDVARAERDINLAIQSTRAAVMDILLSFPASVLGALGNISPDDILKDGVYGPAAGPFKSQTALGKFFDLNPGLKAFRKSIKQQTGGLTGEDLKEFIANEIPKMIFDAYAPIFKMGLGALGVTKEKLKQIFDRADDPGFDPKIMLQQLNDYVQVIVGLQEAAKFLGTVADDGSGWNMKAEAANLLLNPTPHGQISELDQKIAAITEAMANMDWEEQVQAGKQLLALTQQRVQVEAQALVAMRNAWLEIEKSTKANSMSIQHDWIGNPDWSIMKYRDDASKAMQSLLGLLNDPDATVDQVKEYSDAAQAAAMSLYSTMKQRYDEEMQLIQQISDAVKTVREGFQGIRDEVTMDQFRTGYDENGNPIHDKRKQADFVLGQQRSLYDQLGKATTPDEVARISGEIQRNAGKLYDLWGRTPEAAAQVLKMMEDAEKAALAQLDALRLAAEARVKTYENAALEALNILTATSDIANAVIAAMQARLQATDPSVYANVNASLGLLQNAITDTDMELGDFGGSLRRTKEDLDAFGTALTGWTNRFSGGRPDTGSDADTGTAAVATAANRGSAPVVILNGSMAALASDLEVRIGNKVFKRTLNVVQRQSAGSNF